MKLLIIPARHPELDQHILSRIPGERPGKPLPEIGDKIIEACLRHGLLVEADEPSLAALLEEAGKKIRRHFSF